MLVSASARCLMLLLLCGAAGGCRASDPEPDAGLPDLLSDLGLTEAAAPEASPVKTIKVAAIQYAAGDYKQVSGCPGDLCGLVHFIDEAAGKGARLIVTPEYALGTSPEPTPAVASVPSSTRLAALSERARALEVHLIVNLLTDEGTVQSPVLRNSQIAYGPDGKVLAVHHKYGLFGNEIGKLTPGTEVQVFPSPLGLTGLLICADIYDNLNLVYELTQNLKARVVAVSMFWTENTVESRLALLTSTFKVYAIVANTTVGPGHGGGIMDRSGAPMAWTRETTPGVVYAEIPAAD